MKQKWTITNKKGDVFAIAKEQGISPITARVLVNRMLDTKDKRDVYLHPSVCGLREASKLLNAVKAAELLKNAVDKGLSIRIIGDYDVDGITSTYLLFSALSKMGAKVSYRIPNRIIDGYGINDSMVDDAIKDGVELLLTCDNGISASDTIAYAKEKGLIVVVTDHHDIPVKNGVQVLPPADVVVNPNQNGETNGFTGYCGCVVAMKVMEAMGADITPYLAYAAMATLCDVMELQDENRTIVVLGLMRLNATKDLGLSALIEANNLERPGLSAYHIGFVVGPCLNASGRLDTAEKALELLLSEDSGKAERLAQELVNLNTERKDMTEAGTKRAIESIENEARTRAFDAGDTDYEKYIDHVIVAYLPDCHESVVGIIAGRIREKYARPVFVLTDSGDIVKGSGRSTESYSMFEEMQKIDDVFLKYGGHPMAAGLSIERARVDELRRRLNENSRLSEEDLMKKVRIDMKLPFENVSIPLINELRLLEPFGKGNEKALFAEKDLRIERASVAGKNKNVLRLNLVNESGFRFVGIYFGDIEAFSELIKGRFGSAEYDKMFKGYRNNVLISATYYPDTNEYNGMITLQAKIQDIDIF